MNVQIRCINGHEATARKEGSSIFADCLTCDEQAEYRFVDEKDCGCGHSWKCPRKQSGSAGGGPDGETGLRSPAPSADSSGASAQSPLYAAITRAHAALGTANVGFSPSEAREILLGILRGEHADG